MQHPHDDHVEEINLIEYLDILRRYWLVLVIVPVVAALIAYVLAPKSDPTYEASATLLVTLASEDGTVRSGDINAASLLAQTYSQLATSRPVLVRVVDDLNLRMTASELGAHVDSSADFNSPLIWVTATFEDPGDATRVANATAASFIDWLGSDQGAAGCRDCVAVVVPAEAGLADGGFPPFVYMALAGMFFLGLVGVGVVLYDRLKDRVQMPDDVDRGTVVPIVAAIPRNGSSRLNGHALNRSTRRPHIETITRPDSPVSNAIRALRMRLQFSVNGTGFGSVAITGPDDSDASSHVAANLAVSFAQNGQRVVLVDANLLRPRMHRLFGSPNELGFSQLLAHPQTRVHPLLLATEEPGLRLLPAGTATHRLSSLLTVERVERVLEQLKAEADIVVIDAPPLGRWDGMLLVNVATHALVVADVGRTRRRALQAAIEDIQSTRTKVLGVVLNGVQHAEV